MPFSFNGKVLFVNLNNLTYEVEEISEDFYRTYMGGPALAGYYILNEIKQNIDPFSPENVIVFAPGVLTGVPVAGMCRFAVCSKSPLTGGWGQSEAGGWWGPELKRAGFDAIVIKGIAPHPVYLYIEDGDVFFFDASHLWGKGSKEAFDLILSEIKQKRARLLLIGQGGENKVRYACITNQLRHFNGRNGLGAVMGSKKLKAIAVYGSKPLKLHDDKAISDIAKECGRIIKENPLTKKLYEFGTSPSVMGNNSAGILPTKNFIYGEFEKAYNISGQKMNETILIGREGCYACPVRCKRVVKGKRFKIIPEFGGPEYETLASFGSLCMIDDLEVVAMANQLCNDYTLDTISTGVTIAFAMECFEHGIINKRDTDGIELCFGNKEALLEIIPKIAKREGFGDILAEGALRASEIIGRGSREFVLTVKGQEIPMHDPRGKYMVGLGYAVCEHGADHMVVPHDTILSSVEQDTFKSVAPFGILEPTLPTEFNWQKVRTFYYLEMWWSFLNVAGVCDFVPAPRSAIPVPLVVETLKAATGWNTSLFEMLKAGERAINIARVFNVRQGFTAKDDTLPKRFYQGIKNGSLEGAFIDKDALETAKRLYYKMAGWDEEGVPTPQKLLELKLDWLVK